MTETTKLVSMTPAEMRRCTEGIVSAMNDAQTVKGFTIDQVLMATGYMLGAGIRQRGGRLTLDAPLRKAFPPLVAGYEAAMKTENTRGSNK